MKNVGALRTGVKRRQLFTKLYGFISHKKCLLKVEKNFKGQAFPVQLWAGTYRSRGSRVAERLDTRHMKVARLSDLGPAAFKPNTNPWHTFLLHAESTSGLYCGRKRGVYLV